MWLPPPCLSSTISPALIPALIYSTPQDKWRPALSSGVLSLMPLVTRNMQRYNFSPEQWQTAFPPIFGHLLLALTKAFCHPKVSSIHFFFYQFGNSGVHYGDCSAQQFPLLIQGDICTAEKVFNRRKRLLSCLTFPTLLIFPSKAGTERSCWRAQVIAISLSLEFLFCSFSIFSVSTQACAQYCLQIRHLGDEWNLLAKSCDVLDFLRSEQLLQLPFHSLVLRTIFSVFAIFSHSPTLPSPPCLSGYHLQFNAYLGWALTIASTMKWPGPCLHA